MSFLTTLDATLRARRVPARERRRIVAEYADHIACEPESEARLGDPAELAGAFASARAARGARRGAAAAVAALALTAAAVFAGQSAQAANSTPLRLVAVAAVVFGAQVALVTGSLALLRTWRRRDASTLPDREVALIHRRSLVALGAGLCTALGLLVAADGVLHRVLALAAIAAMLAAGVAIVRARRVHGAVPGPSGDLADDVPLPAALAARPWALCALVAVAVGGLMTLGAGQAESSLAEGLQRGGAEALAIVACFALLGRVVGLRGEPDAG